MTRIKEHLQINMPDIPLRILNPMDIDCLEVSELSPKQRSVTRKCTTKSLGRRRMSLSPLGEGMSANVYLGWNRKNNSPLAVKQYRHQYRELCGNEKSILEILNRNPTDHIIKLLDQNSLRDIGMDSDYCLAIDYCPVGDLFSLVQQRPFSEELARTYMQQLLSAVKQCHEAMIYHRDLKLENCLIGSDYSLHLADFGSAMNSFPFRNPLVKGMTGTTPMMSPEIVNGEKYRPVEADIWALGVMCFTMLAGTYPVGKASYNDIWFKMIYDGNYDCFWATHARYGLMISDEARDFISRALQINPMDRLSLVEMLSHPWLSKEALSRNELTIQMQSLRPWNDESATDHMLGSISYKSVIVSSASELPVRINRLALRPLTVPHPVPVPPPQACSRINSSRSRSMIHGVTPM